MDASSDDNALSRHAERHVDDDHIRHLCYRRHASVNWKQNTWGPGKKICHRPTSLPACAMTQSCTCEYYTKLAGRGPLKAKPRNVIKMWFLSLLLLCSAPRKFSYPNVTLKLNLWPCKILEHFWLAAINLDL